MGDGFGESRHDLAIGGLALAEGEFKAVKAMNASYAGNCLGFRSGMKIYAHDAIFCNSVGAPLGFCAVGGRRRGRGLPCVRRRWIAPATLRDR